MTAEVVKIARRTEGALTTVVFISVIKESGILLHCIPLLVCVAPIFDRPIVPVEAKLISRVGTAECVPSPDEGDLVRWPHRVVIWHLLDGCGGWFIAVLLELESLLILPLYADITVPLQKEWTAVPTSLGQVI